MPESKLIIRKENLPTRCDICHQSDQFDPATGQCLRCAQIPAPLLYQATASDPHQISQHFDQGRETSGLRFLASRVMVVSGISLLVCLGGCGVGVSLARAEFLAPLGIVLLLIGGAAGLIALFSLILALGIGFIVAIIWITKGISELMKK